MKTSLFMCATLFVIGALNWLVIQKEQVLSSGRTLLLELAPRDPRSIMQGDYMVLSYAVSRAAGSVLQQNVTDEYLVLGIDDRHVGTFRRIHAGAPLAADEVLIRFRRRGWIDVRLGAESYFFQEGQAEVFNASRFGELKLDRSGEPVLVGLRDSQLNPIGKAGR